MRWQGVFCWTANWTSDHGDEIENRSKRCGGDLERTGRCCWCELLCGWLHSLWLTPLRGGDAGWGQNQGEAEERRRDRAQPWTRLQHTDRGWGSEREFSTLEICVKWLVEGTVNVSCLKLILKVENCKQEYYYLNTPRPTDPHTPPLQPFARLATEMHTETRNTKVSPFCPLLTLQSKCQWQQWVHIFR